MRVFLESALIQVLGLAGCYGFSLSEMRLYWLNCYELPPPLYVMSTFWRLYVEFYFVWRYPKIDWLLVVFLLRWLQMVSMGIGWRCLISYLGPNWLMIIYCIVLEYYCVTGKIKLCLRCVLRGFCLCILHNTCSDPYPVSYTTLLPQVGTRNCIDLISHVIRP